MIHNLNAMKRTMMIIAVILIILALMIVVFHHLIWVLWMNWFPEKVTLGDTESWQGGTIYEKLPYADDHESQYLDLYIPDTQGKKPLFLLIHGGGFVGTIQAFVPEDRLAGFKSGIERVYGEGSCHILRIRPQGGCVILPE